MIQNIRNIAIIAHIDHGKSTIADRLIEACKGVDPREMKNQILDSMDIERERGITIKSQTVRLKYRSKAGKDYVINLVDTPGHVDFGYEVSRALAACESSLLIVDASQGVEAQTLANVYQAIDNNHTIIIALNKIDLPAAEPERVREQIEEIIGIDASGAVPVSAKLGTGIDEVLEAIVNTCPQPTTNSEAPLCALLVDSWYDAYLGVVILVRIMDGRMKKGTKVRMVATNSTYTIESVGIFAPKKTMVDELKAGEIGFFVAAIKQVSDCRVGDTIVEANNSEPRVLQGFKPHVPVVFCGLYPTDSSDFEKLRESLAKLQLNDSSFEYTTESSGALGIGFRCGFLGLLHLEIIQERLEREFDLDLITTAPSVIYKVHTTKKQILEIHNPVDMPDPVHIEFIEEPWIKATIIVPDRYIGTVMELCVEKRGKQLNISYMGSRVMLTYNLPLNEIVLDFNDKLKSKSQGYASFDWEFDDYKQGDLVKLTILINAEPVDAFSMIVPKGQAASKGRDLCEKLKELIPRQQYQVAIQASIGAKVVARETISAFRKDVTAKCYGGDVTRKNKLLKKQQEGKKRMRQVGNIEIPKAVFIKALRI